MARVFPLPLLCGAVGPYWAYGAFFCENGCLVLAPTWRGGGLHEAKCLFFECRRPFQLSLVRCFILTRTACSLVYMLFETGLPLGEEGFCC